MSISGKKPTLAEYALQHVIVFLICIVFPGLTTMMAPASWLSFERSGDEVKCTASTCVYFVIPFRVQTLESVIDIGQRVRDGRTERKRKFGRTTDETVHVDGEGFLQIRGGDQKVIEVSVSPASIESVVDKANRFLDGKEKTSMRMFVIANWKFGAIMGGVLTCFTALYVVGYSLGALKGMLGLMMKLVRSGGS